MMSQDMEKLQRFRDLTTVQPEIPRDRWGRPLIVPPGGGKPVSYTRCTTYVSALEDTYNLGLWQQRMVAKGMAERPDLVLSAASLVTDMDGNKARINKLCDEAREAAAASAAATTGTALHALTERLDRGLPVGTVPPQYMPHLKAYEEATKDFEAIHIEAFTVLDELQIGGTPDRVMRIAGERGLFIGDIKTGKIDFGAGKMAMQLAVYSHSLLYRDGQRRPYILTGDSDDEADDQVRTDLGVIINLDATTGQCSLHWIDLKAGWEGVQLCTQVRAWRKRKDLIGPYATTQPTPALAPVVPLDPSRDATAAAVSSALTAAATVEQLVQVWTEADRRGVWSAEHTELAARRKAELTQATAQAPA